MSDNSNPYQSPEAPIVPENINSGVLTGTMLGFLKDASPWIRFMGIVMFVGFGFMCLIALLSLIGFSAMGNIDIPGFGEMGSVIGIILFIVYVATAVILFFPALFLFKFGNGIRSYVASNSAADLETAFKNNKSYWLFVGILTIISIVLSVISIPVSISLISLMNLF